MDKITNRKFNYILSQLSAVSIMRDLILIGGGGHCKSCIDVIELETKYAIAGIEPFAQPAKICQSGVDAKNSKWLPRLSKMPLCGAL
jgi:hypothetical protein